MDGSHRITIATLEHDEFPKVLTVDYKEMRLYWTDFAAKEILSANFDGSDRRVVYNKVEQPYSVAVHEVERDCFK